MTIDRDNLDRITKVTYPDATDEQFDYTQVFLPLAAPQAILNLTTSVDRLGRPTTRHYNRNRPMDSITDLVGATLFGWCTCGSLTYIVDPDGSAHATRFLRDLQGRVMQKVFADGTTIDYLYEGLSGPGFVGTTSRLKSTTDASGRRTNYSYYEDDNIHQVSYTDSNGNSLNPPTASVSYTYDLNYNRVVSMIDGTGQSIFYYYPIEASPTLGAGQLQYIDGPFASDTVGLTYDELGRVRSRSIDLIVENIERDALGRATDAYNTLGHFVSTYDGVSSRIRRLDYPNPK